MGVDINAECNKKYACVHSCYVMQVKIVVGSDFPPTKPGQQSPDFLMVLTICLPDYPVLVRGRLRMSFFSSLPTQTVKCTIILHNGCGISRFLNVEIRPVYARHNSTQTTLRSIEIDTPYLNCTKTGLHGFTHNGRPSSTTGSSHKVNKLPSSWLCARDRSPGTAGSSDQGTSA